MLKVTLPRLHNTWSSMQRGFPDLILEQEKGINRKTSRNPNEVVV